MQQMGQISESDTSGSDSDKSSKSSKMHQKMSVWVDVGSGQLEMLGCSPRFSSILREPENEGFLDWVVREQRKDFLAWLQTAAVERTGATRIITLRPPRRGGDGPGLVKVRKQSYICGAFVFPEELPENPDPSQIQAVRLDLHAWRNGAGNVLPVRQVRSPPRDVLLWVEIPSKRILKSQHTPRLMFQEGSCLMSDTEVDRLFSCISASWVGVRPGSDGENACPLVLGAYTLTSGDYQIHTEISLLGAGESWRDSGRSWCR